VVGFDRDVADMFPRSKVLAVDLSPEGFAALVGYIHRSYALDSHGRPVIVGPSAYGVGFFYLARGQYRLLDNSNVWAARALEVAGCPVDAEAAITAGALLDRAGRFAHVVRRGAQRRASDEAAVGCR
jgi:hypothetical protein